MKRCLALGASAASAFAALAMIGPSTTGADMASGQAATGNVTSGPGSEVWEPVGGLAPATPAPPEPPVRPDQVVMIPAGDDGLPVLGDWDGDGVDTPAVWFPLGTRGALRFPDGSIIASAGSADGMPVVGDWDGDGIDSVVTWNRAVGPGAAVVSGDLDGDGFDTVAVVPVEEGTTAVAGDWNGDGIDTIAVLTELRPGVIALDDGNGAATQLDVPLGAPPAAGAIDAETFDDELAALRRQAGGRLPNRTIEAVPDAVGPDGTAVPLTRVWGITVASDMADQLEALLEAAYIDGIELKGWGWRSHQQQIDLRRAHCGPSEWAIWQAPASSCSPPTARPGLSRHEVGRAVDFTEAGSILTRESAGFRWLQENAERFGFINLPSEPWHWSDTGG